MHITEHPKLVVIFGGSGFVGRHVVRALANSGYRILVAVRRPDLASFLQPLGNVGQIRAIQANLRYRWSVERAVRDADIVVNLVGILRETGKQKFNSVQAQGARYVAEAAMAAGVPLVHGSAIGADPQAVSDYARTKGEAEQAVLSLCPKAVILRPSVIFGPEDEFFNRFASMARYSPFLPMIGGGRTRLQPVFVGDVARAVLAAVDGRLSGGRVYELGGPEVLTFRQCLEFIENDTNRHRLLLSLPFFFAKGIGRVFGWLPGFPITYDQVVQLQRDNVVSEQAKKAGLTLEGIGIEPKTVESVVPNYLVRFRVHGQFTRKGTA